ncbi:hypothetical protein ILUMI_15925 [Ignelater luminosus]|uniref:Uncharacterized protein n=1 Tax=Ignelater luminosus TaxID=2038154 RepID=A0A8K0G9F6_IGNLU|nr:hypothetical protein ILUMI_15925 [Ignelater luminosus]
MERLLLTMVGEGTESNKNKNRIEENFPFEEIRELQDLDSKIREVEFRENLEKILFLVGGQDFHKNIYNILKRIFTVIGLAVLGHGKRRKTIFYFVTALCCT